MPDSILNTAAVEAKPLTAARLQECMEAGLEEMMKPPEPHVPVISARSKRMLMIRRFRRAAVIMEDNDGLTPEEAFKQADRECFGIACAIGS